MTSTQPPVTGAAAASPAAASSAAPAASSVPSASPPSGTAAASARDPRLPPATLQRSKWSQADFNLERSLELAELAERGYAPCAVTIDDVLSVNIVDRECAEAHLEKLQCVDVAKRAAFAASGKEQIYARYSATVKDKPFLFSCRCCRVHFTLREPMLTHISIRHASQDWKSASYMPASMQAKAADSKERPRRAAAMPAAAAAPASEEDEADASSSRKSRPSRSSAPAANPDLSRVSSASSAGKPSRLSIPRRQRETATLGSDEGEAAGGADSGAAASAFGVYKSIRQKKLEAAVVSMRELRQRNFEEVKLTRKDFHNVPVEQVPVMREYLRRFECTDPASDSLPKLGSRHHLPSTRPAYVCRCGAVNASHIGNLSRHILVAHTRFPARCIRDNCGEQINSLDAFTQHLEQAHDQTPKADHVEGADADMEAPTEEDAEGRQEEAEGEQEPEAEEDQEMQEPTSGEKEESPAAVKSALPVIDERDAAALLMTGLAASPQNAGVQQPQETPLQPSTPSPDLLSPLSNLLPASSTLSPPPPSSATTPAAAAASKGGLPAISSFPPVPTNKVSPPPPAAPAAAAVVAAAPRPRDNSTIRRATAATAVQQEFERSKALLQDRLNQSNAKIQRLELEATKHAEALARRDDQIANLKTMYRQLVGLQRPPGLPTAPKHAANSQEAHRPPTPAAAGAAAAAPAAASSASPAAAADAASSASAPAAAAASSSAAASASSGAAPWPGVPLDLHEKILHQSEIFERQLMKTEVALKKSERSLDDWRTKFGFGTPLDAQAYLTKAADESKQTVRNIAIQDCMEKLSSLRNSQPPSQSQQIWQHTYASLPLPSLPNGSHLLPQQPPPLPDVFSFMPPNSLPYHLHASLYGLPPMPNFSAMQPPPQMAFSHMQQQQPQPPPIPAPAVAVAKHRNSIGGNGNGNGVGLPPRPRVEDESKAAPPPPSPTFAGHKRALESSTPPPVAAASVFRPPTPVSAALPFGSVLPPWLQPYAVMTTASPAVGQEERPAKRPNHGPVA